MQGQAQEVLRLANLKKLLELPFPVSRVSLTARPRSVMAMSKLVTEAINPEQANGALLSCHIQANTAFRAWAKFGRNEAVRIFYELLSHRNYKKFLDSDNMVKVFISKTNEYIKNPDSAQLAVLVQVKLAILSALESPGERPSPIHVLLENKTLAEPQMKARLDELFILGFSAAEPNHIGDTALHASIKCQPPRITEHILQKLKIQNLLQDVLEYKNKAGNLPLHLAAAKAYANLIKTMLSQSNISTYMDVTNNDNYTALHVAVLFKRAGLSSENIKDINSIIDSLMAVGANYLAYDGQGRNMLHIAACNGLVEAITAIYGRLKLQQLAGVISADQLAKVFNAQAAGDMHRNKTIITFAEEGRHSNVAEKVRSILSEIASLPRPEASQVVVPKPEGRQVVLPPQDPPAAASLPKLTAMAFKPVAAGTSLPATSSIAAAAAVSRAKLRRVDHEQGKALP
ncbi:MAG: hypothetical protein K0Q57_1106 [Gammaproteobacteria bacterium]|jgi:ankyrin repeat protein|nr:hypothetical protein [Gammaproteobacteria bacterium]